jgi:general secretion pathway protein D
MSTRQFCAFVSFLVASTTSLLAGTISVQPSSLDETVGQNFTLTVQISGVSDLYGYQFDLGFDPAFLAASSVTEGPFLESGGPTIFIPGTIDNAAGSITANADILAGSVAGVDGSGTLLTFSFQALAAGSDTVQIFNVLALNSFGQGISLITSGSTVVVSASTASTPEPASVLLIGPAIVTMFVFRRRFLLRS